MNCRVGMGTLEWLLPPDSSLLDPFTRTTVWLGNPRSRVATAWAGLKSGLGGQRVQEHFSLLAD